MINSMTGYGSAEGRLDGVTYAVEIRTVNNRYFKSRVKLPESAAFIEEEVEKVLRGDLSRGTVNYTLSLKGVSADVLFSIDEAALKAYIAKLGSIAESSKVKCRLDIGGLMTLPGILVASLPDKEQAGQIKETVLSVTRQALEGVKQMRATEGAALAADLDGHCKAVKQALEQIRSRSEIVVQEYHKKLAKRVGELLAGAKLKLDEESLSREVAIFADRSDISEEIARLESHLQQFSESCESGGQAGRKLDFISQEMLREANTIASKASDTEIIRLVVDIKCSIDRIKEQVQNVE